MGLRFRKSINLGGGAKINFSKSGVGYSIGTKGARITKKANGGSKTTLSVPGTGISYVKESKDKRKAFNTSEGGTKGGSMGNTGGPKKRNTLLWVLGWLSIFPLPLTILLLRKKEMTPGKKYGFIVVAWSVYLIMAAVANKNDKSTNRSFSQVEQSTVLQGEKSKISEITFGNGEDITVKIGETGVVGKVKVTSNDWFYYPNDGDVTFASANSEVVRISPLRVSGSDVYYTIEAVNPGETYVYATSKDGTITSEKIKVTVPQPIEVEKIDLDGPVEELALSQSIKIPVIISPENADNQQISWDISDASVVSVDQDGTITGIKGGTAVITAKAYNGISSSMEVTVNPSKKLMNLRVNYTRDDDNNIGDEWSYMTEINGEVARGDYIVSAGEFIKLHAKFVEEDDKPDTGEVTQTYKVTEEDLENGFTVPMELYVKENGGRNSGKRAHFKVEYKFTVK
jgi:hypothetical protein